MNVERERCRTRSGQERAPRPSAEEQAGNREATKRQNDGESERRQREHPPDPSISDSPDASPVPVTPKLVVTSSRWPDPRYTKGLEEDEGG